MQDSGRDSKPGCGAKNVARPINMATMRTDQYRAVMAELFADRPAPINGVCQLCGRFTDNCECTG